MKYILSRAYVEFGPFEASEILSFDQRGLIQEGDFIKAENASAWQSCQEWIRWHSAGAKAAEQAPAAKPKAPVKQAVAAKKAVAKKPAAKKKAAAKKKPKGE